MSLHQAENLPPGFARATNVPILAARLRNGLHPDRLVRAFEAVVARHQALRLRLVSVSGELRQSIVDPGGRIVDDCALPGVPSDADLTCEFEEILSHPMDLAADGPTIARLLRLEDGSYGALFAVNHVAADGWSVGVLKRDIAQLYQGLAEQALPELEEDCYSHYVRQQRGYGDALTPRQAEFFRSSLRGIPALAARRRFEKTPAQSYRHIQRQLAPQDALAVFSLAKQLRTTPAKILMAASFLAMKAYFGQDTFGVLDVSAGRARGQADWVGLLSKAVPVPVEAPDDMTVGQFVGNVHKHSMQALHMLAGPYSLKRVLTLLHQSGESELGGALYRRFWTDETPSSHSVMFNCLTILPTTASPFGADVEFRPLFPHAPLAPEKSRISDLDVLPVIDGTAITIAVAAHPAVHDATDTEFVLASLERILADWAHSWDAQQAIGRYRRLAD